MKEEKPKGDFQIQEERRLFYVALTRARAAPDAFDLVNKCKKPSPFLDDFLMNAQNSKRSTQRSLPRKLRAAAEETTGPERQFPATPRSSLRRG